MQRRGRPRVGRCDCRNLRANLGQGYGDGKSFRSQGGTVGQARTTCGVDPFSNRTVHHGGAVRLCSAVDETQGTGGCGLLKLAMDSDFDCPGRRYGYPRLAVPAGGAETEGRPAAALSACGGFERADLAGLVVTFPRKAEQGSLPKVPTLD